MANDFDLPINPVSGSTIEIKANDASSITGTEKVLIVQSGAIKETTTQDIADLGGSSYLVYTALLSQTGTSAPVATVLENTFPINDFTWNRTAEGQYYIESLSNQFTVGKTVAFNTNYAVNPDYIIQAGGNEGNDYVYVYTALADGTYIDQILNGTQAVEIRVYP